MTTHTGRRTRVRSAVGRAVLAGCVLALALASAAPAGAQDVKDLMGRSQSQSQQRAVEDLIKKLEGGAAAKRDSAPPAQAAPQPPPAAEPPRTAAPASVPVPAPGATKPQIAVSPQPSPPPAAPSVATRPAAEPDREQITSDPDIAPATPAAASPPSRPPAAAPPAVRPAVRPAPPSVQPERVDTARIDAMPSVDIEIYFDYNSAAVTAQAAATLSVLAQALKDPRLISARFLIGGHTDAKGGSDFNLELSERRAQSVRRFLIDKHGIDAGRLVAQGFGMQRPKAGLRPMDVQNRRVQVVNLTAAAR